MSGQTAAGRTGVVQNAAIDGRCPIDHQHLAVYTLGDPALEAEVLELFADQAVQTLEMMVGARDELGWRHAAHAMKGSARAIGAWRVAEYAAAAEERGRHGGLGRNESMDALSEALDEVCRYIADYEPMSA